jgi:hypothetical protein
MTCIHLRELYQFCQNEGLKLSSTDLVRVVCEQCGVHDVCPSQLMDDQSEEPESQDSPQGEVST